MWARERTGIFVRRFTFALVPMLAVTACTQPAPVQVQDVWTRDTVGNTANAAVFMTISSETPDRLLSAKAAIANKTDLMTMAGANGAMAMEYVKGIEIPANTPVTLNPSGLHVWLADLKQPLKAGQSFPLVLQFEKSGQREVTVKVIAPTAAPPMAGMRM
jgi:copper(I)-binding protein